MFQTVPWLVSEPSLQDLLATPYADLFIPSPSYLLASLALPCFFNEPLLLKGKEKNPSNSIPRKLYECNPFENPARYFRLSSFYMKGNSRFESKQAHLFSTETIEKDAQSPSRCLRELTHCLCVLGLGGEAPTVHRGGQRVIGDAKQRSPTAASSSNVCTARLFLFLPKFL